MLGKKKVQKVRRKNVKIYIFTFDDTNMFGNSIHFVNILFLQDSRVVAEESGFDENRSTVNSSIGTQVGLLIVFENDR